MKATLCNTEVVKNIMAGRQTQDRRPLRNQSDIPANWDNWCDDSKFNYLRDSDILKRQPGDILGLRERVRLIAGDMNKYPRRAWFQYESDGKKTGLIYVPDRIKHIEVGHCVPNGCFTELIRTFLKVKRVWVERGCDISEADAKAEGCDIDWYQDVSEWWDTEKEVRWPCPKCLGKRLHNGVAASGGVIYDIDCTSCNTSKKMYRHLIESIYPNSWKKWFECCEFELCDKPLDI